MSKIDAIIEFINDELLDEPEDIVKDTSLFQDRILDSLNLVMLIGFLEEKFGIKIKTSEVSIENLDTVAKMITFIDKKTN
jgi:acyl carrier protein